MVRGDRHQLLAFEVPQAGAVDFIDVAGAAGDQFGGFLQRVVAAVALTGQQQDQILLGAHSLKMLQLLLLGALIEFKGDLQARVLGFEVDGRGGWCFVEDLINRQQIAAQQMTVVLFVGFAQFQHAQCTGRRVQGVAHQIMRADGQLLLDRIVQLIARFGLHQAGVG